MARLRISLGRVPGLENLPIPVEVLDRDLVSRWSEDVLVGGSREVELLPGRYAIRAFLPSGETLTTKVHLEDSPGATTVRVEKAGRSPREELAWAGVTNPEILHHRRVKEEQLRSIWLRVWRRNVAKQWEVVPWPKQVPVRFEDIVQYGLDLRGPNIHDLAYLQVGGPNVAWKLIALPTDQLRVVFTASERPEIKTDAVQVTVASTSSEAESLLGFLKTGAVEQARTFAEALLRDKRRNPSLAAVGAYYLLKVGDLERLHDWTSNLSNWMKWMPDGAVIYGWHLLRQPEPDAQRAKRQFLDAAARGLPIYTAGLRLLRDGLLLFDRAENGDDLRVRDALQTVLRFWSVADWTAETTTFRGVDPASPASQKKTGLPDDPSHVIFLAEIEVTDLIWSGALKPGDVLRVKSPATGETTKLELTPRGEVRLPNKSSAEELVHPHRGEVYLSSPVSWLLKILVRAFPRWGRAAAYLQGMPMTMELEEVVDALRKTAGTESDPWSLVETASGKSLAAIRRAAQGEG